MATKDFARAEGFPPAYGADSALLILGSFPSVKSRAVNFYYGNRQNRFWKTMCGYFGEVVPEGIEGKKEFLLRRKIALWDVIVSCEIVGSSDALIRGETVSDVPALLNVCPVKKIFCNGAKSYALFAERFPKLLPMTEKLPSTSPANPRFSQAVWYAALDGVFKGENA